MRNRYHADIESFIDSTEQDVNLRCINWCVDIYVFTEQLSLALAAKWRRAAYLQGTTSVLQPYYEKREGDRE